MKKTHQGRIAFLLIFPSLLFFGLHLTSSPLSERPGTEQVSGKRLFTIDDALSLEILRFSSDYGVSPDGKSIAYGVKDGYLTNAKVKTRYYFVPRGFYVFVKAFSDPEPIQITKGEEYSWTPSWSPDAQKLAFYVWHGHQICIGLLDRKAQNIDYIEAAYLNGKGSLDWSPQGDKLYYFPSRFDLFEPIMPYEENEKTIVRTTWEKDPYEERFTDIRKSELWALDIKTKKTSPVISEETSLETHALSPDGKKMAVLVLTKRPVLTHLVPSYAKLEILPLEGGQSKTVFSDKLYTTPYAWSADSRFMAFVNDGKLAVYDLIENKTITLNKSDIKVGGVPAWHPGGRYILCSAGQDYYVFSVPTGEARLLNIGLPYGIQQYQWDSSGKYIYLKVVDDKTGNQGIYRLDWKQGKSEKLLFGDWLISQPRWVKDRLFLTLQNKSTPENVWALDLGTKGKTKLTDTNKKSGGFSFGYSKLFHWKTGDGDPLKGVFIYPADYVEGQKYPVILWVYETFSQDLHRFFGQLYNLQILTNHGFAILMPDIKFAMGETARSFKESVVPAMDGLIEAGIANGNFGVMGWSYGGFATNILITQTTRFKAAVTSCGITDWASKISMQGDFWRRGDQIGQGRLGGTLWEVQQNYIKNSPVFQLDKVQTPILLLHGTNDRNVPFSQAEEMYYGLRDLGKTAMLVAYPGETHLGGDAEVWVIKDMWQRILAWFNKYLK